MTDEKDNYCTKDGMCGLPEGASDDVCKHCEPSVSFSLCIYRAYFADRCLSPFAIADARGEAPPVMPEAFQETGLR